jgi:hypothetical protein
VDGSHPEARPADHAEYAEKISDNVGDEGDFVHHFIGHFLSSAFSV